MPFCHVTLKARRPPDSKYPKELRTLGDHIRKRRLDLGLFQEHAADQIGVDEDTIYRWESNESIPQVRFIPTIIKLLGYNPFPLPEESRGKLVFHRQLLGPSQRKLAKRTGVDPKAVGLYEQGKRPVSKKLLKLLGAFKKTSQVGLLVVNGFELLPNGKVMAKSKNSLVFSRA